jgi:uncharacterized membrane protein
MLMVRTILYLFAGVLLGLLIHLVVILILPSLATNNLAARLAAIGQANKTVLLADVAPGAANPLRLDPNLTYAVCRLNLHDAPGEVTGTLPLAFWSVAVYDRSGTVLYSTTNRDSVGQTLDIGVFDQDQTRLLAEQQIDVAAGLLIVEAKAEDVFVVVRLAPPQPEMRDRYKAQLGKLACRNLKT